MGLLENEVPTSTTSDNPTEQPVTKKVEIVDSMAKLQLLDKPATIVTRADLAEHFTKTILRKHSICDELHWCLTDMMCHSFLSLNSQFFTASLTPHLLQSATETSTCPHKNKDEVDQVPSSKLSANFRAKGTQSCRGLGK